MKGSLFINMLSRTSQSGEPVIYSYKHLWSLLKKCFWVTYILKGDDTGAHTNQIEQEYRDVSPCHDTEMMCFLHNGGRPILFNDTKFSAEAWNCLNFSAEILGNSRAMPLSQHSKYISHSFTKYLLTNLRKSAVSLPTGQWNPLK